MGSYRLELASTGRAGCQNKECKDAKVKIQKGELRMGTWVDSERIQAFMWRHWGCVTPKLVSNINNTMEEEGSGGDGDEKDYSAIDGYEEIPEEFQEKVRHALEQGHVDDEDWKGDVEMNRPGKTGFRIRKKKGDAAEEDNTAEEKEQQTPKTKKRGKAQAEDKDDDQDEEKPKPKRGKKATKQEAEPDNGNAGEEKEEAEEPGAKPAKRGRSSKATASKEDNEPKVENKRATRQKRMSTADDDEAEAEPAEEKPKRGRKKKSA